MGVCTCAFSICAPLPRGTTKEARKGCQILTCLLGTELWSSTGAASHPSGPFIKKKKNQMEMSLLRQIHQ